MANPTSTITLYSNILSGGDEVMAFRSESERDAYFNNHIVKANVNCTIIRRTGQVKFHCRESEMETIRLCNYISIFNPATDKIRYYCKILSTPEYINRNTVLINYAIDSWYTYAHKASYDATPMRREQLTEHEYALATADPYRMDIPKLQTTEEVPTGPEYEPLYAADKSVIRPSLRVQAGYYGSPVYQEFVRTPVFTIIMSPFNLSQFPTYNQFFNYFDYVGGAPVDSYPYFGSPTAGTLRSFMVLGIKATPVAQAVETLREVIDWITINGLADTIVGIYVLPFLMLALDTGSFYVNGGAVETWNEPPPLDQIDADDYHFVDIDTTPLDVHNPKLNRFPFRYLRVTTPAGDVKEYKIERFHNAINGARLMLAGNITGLPTLAVVPIDYQFADAESFAPLAFTERLNYNERIEYTGYLQSAYNIDSYLVYIANSCSSVLENKTSYNVAAENLRKQSTAYGNIGNILGAIGDTASSTAATGIGGFSAAARGTGTIGNGMADEFDRQDYKMRLEAGNLIRKSATPDRASYSFIYDDFFEPGRITNVAHIYRPGASAGFMSYELYQHVPHYRVVGMADEYTATVDEYFTNYGYRCVEIKVPAIVEYIKGGTDPEKLPQFLTNSNGDKVSFCQTLAATVKGIPINDARAIEAMLNGGVRFVKYEG